MRGLQRYKLFVHVKIIKKNKIGFFMDFEDEIQQFEKSLEIRTIGSIATDDKILLQPVFRQPGLAWSIQDSSYYIESCLMGIVMCTQFSLREENGKYTLIDGFYRIDALKKFINNKYPLTALKALDRFNGLYFKDLPEKEQITLTGIQIDITVYKNLSDRLAENFYKRINEKF